MRNASEPDSEILRLGREFEPLYARFLAGIAKETAEREVLYQRVYEATGYRHGVDSPKYDEPGREKYWDEFCRISREHHAGKPDTSPFWDPLREPMDEIAERLCELEPKTLAELGVIARVLAWALHEDWDDPEEDDTIFTLLRRRFVENVLRVAGLPPPRQIA